MKTKTVLRRAFLSAALALAGSALSKAATFETDFNNGIPPGIALYGNANDYDHSTGGVNNSGVLKITTATASQQGGAIIADFDNGNPVAGFDATFNLLIGGGSAADGMSFVYGEYADGAWGEEGPGTIKGLTISFDSFNNGGTPAESPAIDVKWDGVIVAHKVYPITGATGGSLTTHRSGTAFWPAKVHVDTDGTLDLALNNVVVYTNLPIFRPVPGGRFGFGARTGNSSDNHFVDDLKLVTFPPDANAGQPTISAISPVPVGANASAVSGVNIVFQDQAFSVAPASVRMTYNGTAVTPTVTRNGDLVTVVYRGTGGLLPSGAATVVVTYSTTSSPALTNSFSYLFTVDPVTPVPASYALPASSADRTKPGFKVRVHQYDGSTFIRSPGDRNLTINAERELANGYIDPVSGQPYPNVIDTSLLPADGFFIEPGIINWNYQSPAGIGNFQAGSTPPRQDALFPGIPGNTGSSDNFGVEILTYLELKAGGYRFGVNSDDGFRASFGFGHDASSAAIVGQFNGGRGSSDTLFDVQITQDGIYPFRLSYWQGTGGADCEFFYLDLNTNQKIPVNDPSSEVKAFRETSAARPSLARVLPVQNWIGAFADDDVVIDIKDGATAVDAASIVLRINNANQTITTSRSGNVTTVTRPGSLTSLLPSGANNVSLIYSFKDSANATVSVTNNYTFNVAPYYTALPAANIVPASQINTFETGFHSRVAQIDRSRDGNQGNGARITGGGDQNRMPWPEVQLNNGNINPTNGLAYPNLAQPGPNNDFTYDFELMNFNTSATGAAANSGLFQSGAPNAPLPGGGHTDENMPGLPGAGTSQAGTESYVMEATTYLSLKRGVYVFGVNSDDGFVVTTAPDPKDTLGSLLGFYNGGRGNSGNLVAPTTPLLPTPGSSGGSTPFNVIVPQDGIYPFRVLYWQGGGGVNAEFFTLNKQNGTVLLVNDIFADNSAVPAYRTYTGPAKPWVKFSVSPTPWDNRVMQSGPAPIQMVGRTRNAANSSDIYNSSDTTRPWADVRIGGVVANGVGNAIRLLLDGNAVAPTFSTNGTDVTVSYKPNPPLASGSAHTAALVYAGSTNSWTFTVQSYQTVHATNVVTGAADTSASGFLAKVTQPTAATANTANTVARAEAQLAGTPSSVAIPGSGPNGSYIVPGIINWNNNMNAGGNGVGIGNFQTNVYGPGWPFPSILDNPIPGVPGTGLTSADYTAAEIFAYLKFDTAGYYRFGINGDDGWAVKLGAPGVSNGQVLFSTDRGGGAQDIPFSFVIPQPGLYPVRVVWYNGTGGANLEFFSYDENGNKIPVNDLSNPASIKAYYKLADSNTPKITRASVSGGVITIEWTGGGILESATSVTGPWTSTGNSTGSFSESANAARKFYRVSR